MRSETIASLRSHHHWRSLPWLLALAVSPLMGGAILPEAFSVMAICIGLSLLAWSPAWLKSTRQIPYSNWIIGFVLAYAVCSMAPIPDSILNWISPERSRLSKEFPNPLGASTSLTVSTSLTINRLWMWAPAIACFLLGRRSALCRGSSQMLLIALSVGLALQCGGVALYKLNEGRSILGLWPLTGMHNTFGTFANRNHFANWTAMAVVVLLGWIGGELLGLKPSNHAPTKYRPKSGLWIVSTLCLIGVAALILSGSRAGILTFLTGCAILALLLSFKVESKQTLHASFIVLILLACLLFAFGDTLAKRMTSFTSDLVRDYPKIQISSDCLRLSISYFWTGTGPGTFFPVYSHYKTVLHDKDVLHAENEYAESALELGWPVFLLISYLLFKWWKKSLLFFRSNHPNHPEVLAGALAALTVFFLHSLGEFLWKIPSNLFLAASLMGHVSGVLDQNSASERVQAGGQGLKWAAFCFGFAILITGIIQAKSLIPWWSGYGLIGKYPPQEELKKIEDSIKLWPWGTHDRYHRFTHLTLKTNEGLSPEASKGRLLRLLRILHKSMGMDPLNWKLRLDALRVQVLIDGITTESVSQAERIAALNPDHFNLKLNLAGVFAEEAPDFALDLLRSIQPAHNTDPAAVLELAWQIEPNASLLWELTPLHANGLNALCDFAHSKEMDRMAELALVKMIGKADIHDIAGRLLQIGSPEKAVEVLEKVRTRQADFLRARAYFSLHDHPECIRFAEDYFRRSPLSGQALQDLPETGENQRPFEQMDEKELLSWIEKYPSNIYFYWRLHDVQSRDLRFSEASASVMKALELLVAAEKKKGLSE